MNLSVFIKGAAKMLASYKLLTFMWLTTMLMICMVALPLKTGLKSIFGKSLATDRLLDGFDLGLTGDMGPAFGQLLSSATVGALILLMVGFLLHTFFAGGLFSKYTTEYGQFSISSFLKSSASHFLTYLGIAVLMMLIILGWTLLTFILPVVLIISSTDDPTSLMKINGLLFALWGLGMPVWFLVADHSRRWVASTGVHRVFKALGEGFGSLKKKFLRSYLVILIITVINVLFVMLAFYLTASSVPEKSLVIFLFFLGTQALFIIRLSLKAWRYATVTELALKYPR